MYELIILPYHLMLEDGFEFISHQKVVEDNMSSSDIAKHKVIARLLAEYLTASQAL